MAFVPRNFEQILTDMVAHVRANSTLTDFTIGSAVRTILEASALEDDEQYYQMVQLLDAFRIATASGVDLDERAADYNLTRLLPKVASGEIVFLNNGLVTSLLEYDISAGAGVSAYVEDSSDFPVAPFNVRIGEGTPEVEDVAVSAHNPTLNLLTITTLVNNHESGARVSLIGGGDKTISSGIQVQVPAKGESPAIVFTSVNKTTLVDGNYESPSVPIKANNTGTESNVSATQISQFSGSGPFTGAGVTNKVETTGGRALETDDEFRARLIRRIAEVARGTKTAVESAAIGVTDVATGKSVATSKLREDFVDPFNNVLYVDDGTGFTPSKTIMAVSTLAVAYPAPGVTTIQVASTSSFPDSGYVIIGVGTANVEYLGYNSIGAGNTINLAAGTANSHALGDEVILAELVAVAEDGQNFFRLSRWPILDNTLELYDNNDGILTKRVEGTDYVVNRSNGEVQYPGPGLLSGTVVFANYSFYTGLLYEVQRVITGDSNDRVNYPGVAAGGIIIQVSTPVIRRISVSVSITSKVGYDELQLRDEVQRAVESYIEGLKINDNVYRARIIEAAMGVVGIENVILVSPTADIVILENELPTPYDTAGDSLVAVL